MLLLRAEIRDLLRGLVLSRKRGTRAAFTSTPNWCSSQGTPCSSWATQEHRLQKETCDCGNGRVAPAEITGHDVLHGFECRSCEHFAPQCETTLNKRQSFQKLIIFVIR